MRFFFVKTLRRHQFRDFFPNRRDRRRLPAILSLEEVTRLINVDSSMAASAFVKKHHSLFIMKPKHLSWGFGKLESSFVTFDQGPVPGILR